jgi:hypothetical protein
VVDSRDDQLRPGLDQAERREAHAVHGRAVGRVAHRPVAELDLLDPERRAGRDAARRRRAVRVGRDHREVDPRHLQQRATHGVQARGLDAVVVGQQNLH